MSVTCSIIKDILLPLQLGVKAEEKKAGNVAKLNNKRWWYNWICWGIWDKLDNAFTATSRANSGFGVYMY